MQLSPQTTHLTHFFHCLLRREQNCGNVLPCNHLAASASFQKCSFHADMDDNLNILACSEQYGVIEIKQIAHQEIWLVNVLRCLMCGSVPMRTYFKKFRKYKSAPVCKKTPQ